MLFLLHAMLYAYNGEATHTNYIAFDLTRSGLELTIYRTRSNHYTTGRGRINVVCVGGVMVSMLA